MLEEAKRQAIKAMDEYNSSSGDYGHFVRDMVRAWLYLLHAEFRLEKIDFHYTNEDGTYKLANDEPKAWELATCLERRFPDADDPIRRNVELFIALRNKIEHRYERELQTVTEGRAHALVINFEAEVVGKFGSQHSLADRLRFPVFLQSMFAVGADEIRRLQRRVPKATSAFLARYEAGLSQDVLGDQRYDFRVRLIPVVGPKTDADMAVDFVNVDNLTEEELSTMMSAGRDGKVVTKVKHVEVASKDKLLPGAVVRLVNDAVPYEFNHYHHGLLYKHFGVRPASTVSDRTLTDARYCVYDEPFKAYVYTKAWVDKIIREAGTAEKLRVLVGVAPRLKVSRLPNQREATAETERPSAAGTTEAG